jgi:hypothetical protein
MRENEIYRCDSQLWALNRLQEFEVDIIIPFVHQTAHNYFRRQHHYCRFFINISPMIFYYYKRKKRFCNNLIEEDGKKVKHSEGLL